MYQYIFKIILDGDVSECQFYLRTSYGIKAKASQIVCDTSEYYLRRQVTEICIKDYNFVDYSEKSIAFSCDGYNHAIQRYNDNNCGLKRNNKATATTTTQLYVVEVIGETDTSSDNRFCTEMQCGENLGPRVENSSAMFDFMFVVIICVGISFVML